MPVSRSDCSSAISFIDRIGPTGMSTVLQMSMTSNLVLVMVHCSMVREDLLEPRQPRRRRGVVRIGLPFRLADQVADRAPHRRLGDEIDVGVGIGLPALALEDPARLAAAGIVAGARHRVAERNAFAVLAVFGQRAVREPLLVAQLDAREIEHAVLHGAEHLLAAAGAVALIERGDNAEREMQAGAANRRSARR